MKQVRLVHYWNQQVLPLIVSSPQQLENDLNCGRVGRITLTAHFKIMKYTKNQSVTLAKVNYFSCNKQQFGQS